MTKTLLSGISALALMAAATTAHAVDAHNPDESRAVALQLKDTATSTMRYVFVGPGMTLREICESCEISTSGAKPVQVEGKKLVKVGPGSLSIQ